MVILLLTSSARAMKCQDYEKVAEYLKTQNFIQASKERQELVFKRIQERLKKRENDKGPHNRAERERLENERKLAESRELTLDVGDIGQAKTLAMRFPAFEDLGYGLPGGKGWQLRPVTMESSVLKGKNVVWQTGDGKNGHAIARLDWDPVKGGHYNIEMMDKDKVTHQLAIKFLCNGSPCTKEEVLKIAERMEK
jgi:hypothetical protein